jgi:hypothetical protein
MKIAKDLLDAMPLDGNVRVATAEQLEAYMKAVTPPVP